MHTKGMRAFILQYLPHFRTNKELLVPVAQPPHSRENAASTRIVRQKRKEGHRRLEGSSRCRWVSGVKRPWGCMIFCWVGALSLLTLYVVPKHPKKNSSADAMDQIYAIVGIIKARDDLEIIWLRSFSLGSASLHFTCTTQPEYVLVSRARRV